MIRERRAIRLADLTAHAESFGFPPNHPPMKSFLGVPVVGRTGVFGNLYLTEKRSRPDFTEEDVYIATLLAAQAAAAVENARLHEQSARLIEEVQQLHRSRERFFATVNHELRNALAGVYGWAEMLVRRKPRETVPQAFEVLESAEHAVSLVNDLLDLSRLDEDRLQTRFGEVDLVPIIGQAVGLTTPAARERGVNVHIETSADLPRGHTDGHRLQQIMVNVIANAVRHSPTGSAVDILASGGGGPDGTDCRVAIEDRGPGIPEEERESVFDIYHTGARDGVAGGTGLGLPLSRRLARLLGGDLWAEARAGGGARLVLDLPAWVDSEDT